MATPTKDAPAIEIRGLFKAYGSLPVLRGLDLSLGWGNFLTIFGPNGSGKTTLIKVLATLARPNEGRARIAGLDLTHAAAVRRAIGVVTHQTFLYADLTAYENLKFSSHMFGLKDPDQRIHQVAQALGLEEHLPRRARTLSHGTQKRVSLARALLHRPQVLLLDEPEAGLDPDALEMLERALKAHLREGGAILMTTHNVERGLALGTRVAILSRGCLAFEEARATLDAASFRETYARVTGVPS